MKRRTFVDALGVAAALAMVPCARAQRATQPIARPPGRRPGVPPAPGRFDWQAGVAYRAWPGVYVVVRVDTDNDTLDLRDGDGRVASVHVSDSVADLASLKPGDEVEVDFLVPEVGSSRIEAGGLWKVQR